MAPTTAETAAKLQAARDLLAAAEAEHAAAVENAPPRPIGEVLYDLMANFTMRFGHHPGLVRLLDELKRALAEVHDNPIEHAPAPPAAA